MRGNESEWEWAWLCLSLSDSIIGIEEYGTMPVGMVRVYVCSVAETCEFWRWFIFLFFSFFFGDFVFTCPVWDMKAGGVEGINGFQIGNEYDCDSLRRGFRV